MKTRKQMSKPAKKERNINKQMRRLGNTKKGITNKKRNPKPTCEMNNEATSNYPHLFLFFRVTPACALTFMVYENVIHALMPSS